MQNIASITPDKSCGFKGSAQHSSILLIRLCFSKRPDPLGFTQSNLNRGVFSLNQRSRTNLAIETPADRTSGECCVDPLRPPGLSETGPLPKFFPGGAGTRPENCYPWVPPPESSRTIEPAKLFASPKSISVLSR